MGVWKMNSLFKKLIALILSLVVIILCFNLTKDAINLSKIGADLGNLQQLFPDSEFSLLENTLNNDSILTIYKVKDKGFVFKISKVGYGNLPIITLVAYDNDGKLVDILVLQHSETEGIGTKAFDAKYFQQLKENKLDVLSGATYTSTALISSIKELQVIVEGLK